MKIIVIKNTEDFPKGTIIELDDNICPIYAFKECNGKMKSIRYDEYAVLYDNPLAVKDSKVYKALRLLDIKDSFKNINECVFTVFYDKDVTIPIYWAISYVEDMITIISNELCEEVLELAKELDMMIVTAVNILNNNKNPLYECFYLGEKLITNCNLTEIKSFIYERFRSISPS